MQPRSIFTQFGIPAVLPHWRHHSLQAMGDIFINFKYKINSLSNCKPSRSNVLTQQVIKVTLAGAAILLNKGGKDAVHRQIW